MYRDHGTLNGPNSSNQQTNNENWSNESFT